MDVKPHATIAEFFHDAIADALKNQRVETSAMTEYYLVNLLSTFLHQSPDDTPVALRLASAVTAPTEERVRQLRDVGDQCLYVSGFFSDSLARGLVDVDYYIHIGGSAYSQLARMPLRGTPSEVFVELSDKFPRLVEVLAEVSLESTAASSPNGVVALYERWLRTGADWIARKLRARGVIPTTEVQ